MVESNFHALDINFIAALDEHEEMVTPHVSDTFTTSPWYVGIIFMLQNLQSSPGLTKTKDRFIKPILLQRN